ncbi:MAG TPA: hypothetical protein EYN46_04040 [Candidatus Poseidoniales archaeon]|nr:hypothetical protein [Candidatus Poseidoniales archaeon]
MAEENGSKISLETWLLVGFTAALLMSTILIVVVSAGKNPVYSAYITDAEGDYQYQQLNLMADDLGDYGAGYTVANTMSTPMLVNDWREPHRTLLVMISPEKPFDDAEATAIHDFVTQRGGKVILASDSANAQRVADKFGVSYFTAPVLDDMNHYETHVPNEPTNKQSTDMRNLWALASVNSDVRDMNVAARTIGCSSEMLATSGSPLSLMHQCRTPVLFRKTTAMQILQEEDPSYPEQTRNAYVLAHASTSSFLDEMGTANLDTGNGQLGEGETELIIRIDYPGIKTTDKVLGEREGEISVTGSIVFVANDDVFANYLWDRDTAERTGHPDHCVEEFYADRKGSCWNGGADGLNPATDTTWKGNGAFFSALISDMMEHDNEDISNTIRLFNDEFYIVFDESRHVTGSLSAPFTEAMGAIVLLTSDIWLKWLIVLNLMALLSIAIMVVPEKENWRHVFDLTRFRERPTKIDPSKFQLRVREAMLNKVRLFYDLSRDQMVLKTPSEVLSMIRDPRLVELAQSQSRTYDDAELRELMQMIRRWGK